MNKHVKITAPAYRGFSQALFSLSQTQRRIAHQYKQFALEAEAKGNLKEYRRCRKESDRLWTDAKWHLKRARLHMDTTQDAIELEQLNG